MNIPISKATKQIFNIVDFVEKLTDLSKQDREELIEALNNLYGLGYTDGLEEITSKCES